MGVTAHVFCLLNPHLTHKTHTQTQEKGNKERLRKAFVSTCIIKTSNSVYTIPKLKC